MGIAILRPFCADLLAACPLPRHSIDQQSSEDRSAIKPSPLVQKEPPRGL